MKKQVLSGILIFCLLFGVWQVASAASGDVVGHIYATDILAYVCQTYVPSYNIGGRTVLVVEEAAENCNSFYYEYSEDERLLTVEGFRAAPVEKSAVRGTVGEILGDVYETDIRVLFNGSEIRGYNIGGKTAVCIEDIGDIEGSVNAEYGYSRYAARHYWNEAERTISLEFPGTYIGYNEPAPQFTCTFQEGGVYKAEYTPERGFCTGRNDEYTPETITEFYVMRPLLFEFQEKREPAGFWFYNYAGIPVFQFTDFDAIKNMLNQYRLAHQPQISYAEARKKFDDGVNFKTLQSIDTPDYTFVLAEELTAPDPQNNISYVSLPKDGGYTVLFSRVWHYDQYTLEAEGNTVTVAVYPFGGPHGATWCRTDYPLDDFR